MEVIKIIEEKIIPLKFDLMFKKVFGDNKDKEPLRNLLRCILDIEAKEITILNPVVIGSSYYDKRTIVDLIVELEDGTKISIEMNTNVNNYLISRNLNYLFKIMSHNFKKGRLYSEFDKHIQINIDCEGSHVEAIERYKIMEEKRHKVLTDKIEIIRIDLPYYVKKCYNQEEGKLDYKDKFIGIIGIEDKKKLKSLIKGEKSMEEIFNKVEDFSKDEEILGAYDAEWHRKETERVVRLSEIENAEERGIEKGIKEGIKEGIEQTALNMLKEKMDIGLISKLTGLNIDQIRKLKD